MEKIVETTGEWIQTRTGIENRCVCVCVTASAHAHAHAHARVDSACVNGKARFREGLTSPEPTGEIATPGGRDAQAGCVGGGRGWGAWKDSKTVSLDR